MRYEIRDEACSEIIEAESLEAAWEQAAEWLRGGDWDRSQTLWVDAHVSALPPYDDEQIEALDEAIDHFTDATGNAWSIDDVEAGDLDHPAEDSPAPSAEMRAVAVALGNLRRAMLTANEAADSQSGTVTVTLDPEVPSCEDGSEEHDWQAPHGIVGGIKDNPGVWGHGGGTVCHEVCMRCGLTCTTDSWATRPDTGEQGLTSVSYDPDKFRQEWAEYQAERETA